MRVVQAGGRRANLSPEPAEARGQLRTLLQSARWPGQVDDAVLAIHEALTNANDHGGGATSASAAVLGPTLLIEVRDRGPGFDVGRYVGHPPDPLAERGRGLWLIGQLADACDLLAAHGETCLRIRFDSAQREFVQHA